MIASLKSYFDLHISFVGHRPLRQFVFRSTGQMGNFQWIGSMQTLFQYRETNDMGKSTYDKVHDPTPLVLNASPDVTTP